MQASKAIIRSEKGLVLVLSIFMLALLTMIGMAAMMSGTTEIEISGGEKHHKVAFYEAESGLTIGGEVLELLMNFDTIVADNTAFDDNNTVIALDGQLLYENRDLPGGSTTWDKENQTVDEIHIARSGDTRHADYPVLTDASSVPDLRVTGDHNIYVDIDNIGAKQIPGGGAEFGASDEGMGASMTRILFNLDCVATLPGSNRNPANHILGYQLLP